MDKHVVRILVGLLMAALGSFVTFSKMFELSRLSYVPEGTIAEITIMFLMLLFGVVIVYFEIYYYWYKDDLKNAS